MLNRLALFAFLLVLAVTPPAFAVGVTMNTGVRFEFTNCSSSGSSAQTVTGGSYLFRVTDDDVYVCYAATCASGGERFPSGTVMLLNFTSSTSVSCRSSASTGDAIFTRGE